MSCQSTSGSSGMGTGSSHNPRGEGMMNDSSSGSESDDDVVDASRAAEETSILTLEWLKSELDSAGEDLFKLSKLPETRDHRGGAWATRCRGIGILLQGTAIGTLMELENARNLLAKAGWRMSTVERHNMDLENQVEFLIAKLGKTRRQVKELEGKVEALKKQVARSGQGEADQEESNNGAADGGIAAEDESEEESEDDPDEGPPPPPPRSALAKKRKSARHPDPHRNGRKRLTWDASVKDSSPRVKGYASTAMTRRILREPGTMPGMVVEENDSDIEQSGSLEASVKTHPLEGECEPGPEDGEDDEDEVVFLGEFGTGTGAAASAASMDDENDQEVPGSSGDSSKVAEVMSLGQNGNALGNDELPGCRSDIGNGDSNTEADETEGVNCQEGNVVPGNDDGEMANVSDPDPPPVTPPKRTYELRRKKNVSYNFLNRGALVPSPPSKLKLKKARVPEGENNTSLGLVGSSTRKSVQCDICDARFGRSDNLRRHLKTVHNSKPPDIAKYKCCLCPGRIFSGRGNYDSHARTHGKRPVKCPECSKVIKHKRHLKQHMLTHDPNRKRSFKCDLCPAMFWTARIRELHNAVHNGIRKFKCKNCPRSFKRQHDLTIHMLVHSNVRRFRCTLCDESFKHRRSLTVHLQRHGNERPYECKECGKTFKTYSNLYLHLPKHSGNKSHKCQFCNLAFSRKDNLRSHQRRIHPSH